MLFTRGDIWHAFVPYNDNPDESKRRPVLVLAVSPQGHEDDRVIVVAPITSFGDGGGAKSGDVPILNWRNINGLDKASWVRARRVWGADTRAFDTQSGRAGTVDQTTLTNVIVEFGKLFS